MPRDSFRKMSNYKVTNMLIQKDVMNALINYWKRVDNVTHIQNVFLQATPFPPFVYVFNVSSFCIRLLNVEYEIELKINVDFSLLCIKKISFNSTVYSIFINSASKLSHLF